MESEVVEQHSSGAMNTFAAMHLIITVGLYEHSCYEYD